MEAQRRKNFRTKFEATIQLSFKAYHFFIPRLVGQYFIKLVDKKKILLTLLESQSKKLSRYCFSQRNTVWVLGVFLFAVFLSIFYAVYSLLI